MAQRARQQPRQRVALGAGLHGGHVELETTRAGSAGRFRVRLCDGRLVSAVADAGVDPELLRECMRSRRMVILVDAPRSPRIVGALETQRPVFTRERGDSVTVSARELRFAAEERLRLEAGPVAVTAEDSGKMRLEGDRLVIDMAALVKVLSMKVELP
jgi:hypothetical protein